MVEDVLSILRDPRGGQPLDVQSLERVDELVRDRPCFVGGPIPTIGLFCDDGRHEKGRDPDQVWDIGTFDAGFIKADYYESGIEFDERLGRPRRLSEFHFQRVKKRLLDWVRPGPEHRVLDIGCGAGYFLCMIRGVYRHEGFEPMMVGLEASSAQLGYARMRLEKEGCKQALGVLGNAEHLPFHDASFDLITCSEVLEHIRTPARALAEMKRVLRPGGQLLLSTPSKLNEDTWDLLFAPFVKIGKRLLSPRRTELHAHESYDVPWYPMELKRALIEAGFSIESFEQTGLIPHPHYFDYLPRPLFNPTMFMFETADAFLADKLKPLTAHLLARATHLRH